MMIPIPKAGVLEEVRGVEAALAVPEIVDVAITAHPGQRLVPLPEGSRYLGFLFSRAADPASAEAALRAAHARLEFRIGRRAKSVGGETRSAAIDVGIPRAFGPRDDRAWSAKRRARSLRRGVVGIAAGGVVGGVEDFPDRRGEAADRLFDALLQCDVGRAATLASPAEAQKDVVLLDVDELDEAAVLADGRVDFPVEEVADRPLEVPLGREGVEVLPGDDRGSGPDVSANDVPDAQGRPVDLVRRRDCDGVVGDEDRLDPRDGQQLRRERGMPGAATAARNGRSRRGGGGGPRVNAQRSPPLEGSPVILISSIPLRV